MTPRRRCIGSERVWRGISDVNCRVSFVSDRYDSGSGDSTARVEEFTTGTKIIVG